MAIGWYLAVSAIIFCIGAGGVLVRRNPLVILLCLELMLNGANLALVAFARMWGGEDGQVFALIVMVVAACEVTVGLGLVVAIYRRRLPDRRRRAQRVAGMSTPPPPAGWSCCARSSGTILIAVGYARWPGRTAGWMATLAIALSFVFSVIAFIKLLGLSPDHRQLTSTLWDYDVSAGVDAKLQILVDPLSVFMMLVVSGVSTLIHLYSVTYMNLDRGYSRYFSYLNYFVFSMLLLVLAGNFVILIVGWAFVGAASYLLISFWYRRTTATRAGIKAFVINVVGDVGLVIATFIMFQHTGTVQFLAVFHAVPHDFAHNSTPIVVACLLLLVGAFAKSAQVPLHTWLPDAMEGPTPVSALIHAATMVTAGVYLIARMHVLFEWAPTAADVGRDRRLSDARGRGHGGDRDDRHQAGDRLLDDVPDRLHDHGRLRRRVLGRPVPPDDPRLLQGAAVHGRRLDHRRDGRRSVAGPHGRLPESAAVHVRLLPGGRSRPVGHAAVLGLAVEGRHHRVPRPSRRRLRGPRHRRLPRRAADRRSTRSG